MIEKSCFFIGRRETGGEVYPALLECTARQADEYGIESFFVGPRGAFDAMAARAVREVKKSRPQVKLWLLLSVYRPEWSLQLPEGFDGSFFPPGMEAVPPRFALARANQYMAANCACLIAHAPHTAGSAQRLLRCAREFEKKGQLRVCLV